ncbi:MAG TPA: fluoride efflux transporter CrcB [Myxococcota bacterium]
MQVLLVGVGGFIGSALRYAISGLVHRAIPFSGFPYGTLVVNLAGCLAIGLLAGLAESRQVIGPELRVFLFLGLLGGFTTFSTFAYEGVELFRDGEFAKVLVSVMVHVLVGFMAVWFGHAITSVR